VEGLEGPRRHRFSDCLVDASRTGRGLWQCAGAPGISCYRRTTSGMSTVAQSRDALMVAQQVRLATAAVIAEVGCNTLTILEALDDERAGCIRISRLLCAQRSWA